MRTTLTIDDDVYETVQAMASASGKRLGEIVTILLRRELSPSDPPPTGSDPKFPFITFPATGETIRSEDVRKALEEEGP